MIMNRRIPHGSSAPERNDPRETKCRPALSALGLTQLPPPTRSMPMAARTGATGALTWPTPLPLVHQGWQGRSPACGARCANDDRGGSTRLEKATSVSNR